MKLVTQNTWKHCQDVSYKIKYFTRDRASQNWPFSLITPYPVPPLGSEQLTPKVT